MRRVLGGAAVAVLALTCLPAVADDEEPSDEPVLNQACAPRTGTDVLIVDGFEGDIETPLPPLGETSRTFVLDLVGLAEGTRATADVLMSWGIPTNDFDLNVNGTDSFNLQPVDPAEENVFVSGLRHCSTVTVTATNFVAPVVVDTLALDITVRTTPPPVVSAPAP